MKYIKTYEHINSKPQIGDWVVAYKPFDNEDENDMVLSYNDMESVFDVGKINRIVDNHYWSVSFPRTDKNYVRRIEHIVYISNNKEDAEKYLSAIKISKKYNL